MKFSIKWHEECARNSRKYLDEQGAIIARKSEALVIDWDKQHFRELQIEEAKRRGLGSFDAERFMVKRKKP